MPKKQFKQKGKHTMHYNTSAILQDTCLTDTLPDNEIETAQTEQFYAWRIRKLRELHKKSQARKAQALKEAN